MITELPSELTEVICCNPGTWPNWRSSGAVTEDAGDVRTGAGIKRHDLDNRIVDFGQRRDGQPQVSDESARRRIPTISSDVATGRRIKASVTGSPSNTLPYQKPATNAVAPAILSPVIWPAGSSRRGRGRRLHGGSDLAVPSCNLSTPVMTTLSLQAPAPKRSPTGRLRWSRL